MNIEKSLNFLFYIDSNKKIALDKNRGICSFIVRAFYAIIGVKNYEIFDVLKVASAPNQKIESSLIKIIYEKTGKILKIEKIVAELINHMDIENSNEKNLIDDLSTHCLNENSIENLEKFRNNLDKNSKIYEIINKVIKETKLKHKLKKITLDPSLAHFYTEEIEYLFKTRLIYSIIGYQNTTESGPIEHELKKETDEHGIPYLSIKKQGQWVPVRQVKEEFDWDEKEGSPSLIHYRYFKAKESFYS